MAFPIFYYPYFRNANKCHYKIKGHEDLTEAQKDTLCGKGTLAYPQSYNPIELEALALEFALEDCQDLPKEAIKKLGKGMFKFVIKINHKMLYHILANRPEIDSPYIDSAVFHSLFECFDEKFVCSAIVYDTRKAITFSECMHFPPN